MEHEERGASRREILQRAVLAAGAAGTASLWAHGFLDFERVAATEPTQPGAPRRTLTELEWRTLDAAFDQLLPKDELGPGARDVNAVGYTDAALQDPALPRAALRVMKRGVVDLNNLARRRRARDYAALAIDARHAVMGEYERTASGIEFIRRGLGFVFEACFGDPLQGANPGSIGWRFAEPPPTKPRPTTPGWRPRER